MIIFLIAEVTAVSILLKYISGTSLWITALIVISSSLIYTLYGGLRASIFTDSLQFIIFIILYFIPFKGINALENKILLKINNEIITSVDVLNEINFISTVNKNTSKISKEELYKISLNSLIKEKIKKIELKKNFKNINIKENYLNNIKTCIKAYNLYAQQ